MFVSPFLKDPKSRSLSQSHLTKIRLPKDENNIFDLKFIFQRSKMAFNVFKSKRDAKIVPSIPVEREDSNEDEKRSSSNESNEEQFEMKVMRLHMLFKLYGGQRHPKLLSFDMLREKGALTEYNINTYPLTRHSFSYLTSGSGWSIPIHVVIRCTTLFCYSSVFREEMSSRRIWTQLKVLRTTIIIRPPRRIGRLC